MYIRNSFFLFVLLIISVCVGCGSADNNIIKDQLEKNQGWLNEHTYRITAEGRALRDKKKLEEKKRSAVKAAVFHAQFKLRQKLVADVKHASPGRIKRINRIINKGKVIFNKFDLEGNCKIVYEIQHNNLKHIISQKK